jgi:hypothetical protein
VSFVELVLDYEAYSGHGIPSMPQSRLHGASLSIHERARILRISLCTISKYTPSGEIFPAHFAFHVKSLRPLGGPNVPGLSIRPFFTKPDYVRRSMIHLEQYLLSNMAARFKKKQHTPTTVLPKTGAALRLRKVAQGSKGEFPFGD